MPNHDDHYKQIEKQFGISMTTVAEMNASRETIPRTQAHNLAQAAKYLIRAGTKGEWRDDVEKARNYLTRALTGDWQEGTYAIKEFEKIVEERRSQKRPRRTILPYEGEIPTWCNLEIQETGENNGKDS